MALRKGLGKGMSALIPTAGDDSSDSGMARGGKAYEVDISLVEPNRDQPRRDFDHDSLDELAASIRVHGVISPVIVKRIEDYYVIIAGERRWRAARMAGLRMLPVVVMELGELETLEVALIENLQRSDLNPVEEAIAYKRLSDEFGQKQDEIARKIGKSRSSVANAMRLLALPESVLGMLRDGRISTGHAKVVLGVQDPDEQERLAEMAVQKGLSVRELEKLVQAKPVADEKKPLNEAAAHTRLEKELSGALGTRTRIKDSGGKGKIEIDYFSPEDLDRLYILLRSAKLSVPDL